MAAKEIAEGEEDMNNTSSAWEALLRRMLPPGAPFPDEEHLDYSIAVEYQGPILPSSLPKINPIEFHSSSMASLTAVTKIRATTSRFSRLETLTKYSINGRHCSFDDFDLTSNPNNSNATLSEIPDQNGESDEFSNSNYSPVNRGDRKQRKRRGTCSRCGKGNRLSEREMCIVCDARYCSTCVLKAMGSMPEGRKCVSCIGHSIDEAKRGYLGKCSKILWKICSELEMKQIMRAEKECLANQLRPEQVVVNGRQLVSEELVELLACERPPGNLKPGRYWYDKDSGLWGKEGEKPDRFISSKLNIAGKLQADASNGNTKVFFNEREITKAELRVLKLAKVQCPRNTHFWVYDDGSYEEEGQNNIKGNIWGKASARFLCALLSLPVPPGKVDNSKEDPTCSGRLLPDYSEQVRNNKLLLLGLGGSGTSAIFKQAKFLYNSKFTSDELQNIKLMIQSNLYKYLGALLEGRERFEEQTMNEKSLVLDVAEDVKLFSDGSSIDERKQCVYSINSRLKKHADWFLEIMATGDLDAFFPAATREYAPLVEELWRDSAIQETYKRKQELQFLPDAAKYFLDRAVEISSNDYEPSEKDILYAGGVTLSNGLTSVEFSFDDRCPMSDTYGENFDHPPPLTRFELIRINLTGQQDGYKLLEMFEDVRAIIFCCALSDYDVMWAQGTDPPRNKMLVSRDMFESLVKHPSFQHIPFVVLLNKYDAFEEKISQVPLTACEWFRDFCPLKPHHSSRSLAHLAYYYVAVKFKETYAALSSRKLYVWPTKGLDRSSVDEAFRFIREVLRWDEEKDEDTYGFMGDYCSTEVSSHQGHS